MGPEDLSGLLGELNHEDPCILCDMTGNEDAGVYKISDDSALVQTVDFITPVVDDPYIFGQIAAANSMSDIWAMGGKVINVLNIVGFDKINLSLDDLKKIYQGAASMVRRSGAVTLGGHTIENLEMFFGLSCTGLIHPDRIIRNSTARPGDRLILTKALGIGSLTTAIKRELVDEELEKEVIAVMMNTNQRASELMTEFGATACTDITGFGLLGHALEMAAADKTLVFQAGQIPRIRESLEFVSRNVIPGGCRKNFDYVKARCHFDEKMSDAEKLLLADPQTSGGLLIAVPENRADDLLNRLRQDGYADAAIVGDVHPRGDISLIINE